MTAMAEPIVVVGAGIAGLATAVALQRGGHDVAVLEERTDTSSGAGISIWPNALAALDHLGVGDAVRARGGRVTAGAMRWRDGAWLRRPNRDRIIDALGEALVVLQRAALTDVLHDALAVGSVRYGVGVRGLSPEREGVALRLSDGGTLHARALVGADGTGSAVARHLNGPLAHTYAGYTAWRGVADIEIDADLCGETLGPGSEVGHVSMGAGRTYWFATERTPAGGARPEGELNYLRSRFADWAEPLPALLAATDPDFVLRHDIYDRSAARRWARGPVVVVGDAAHAMRPHLGQGGCQAIEDAAILAEFVGRGDLPDAFVGFEVFRRPRVAALVRQSAAMGRALNLQPAWLSSAAARASAAVPEWLLTRQMAAVAGREAFLLP